MSRPVAGDAIAFLCVKVIRGIKTPFVVDFTSSKEDEFGDVVPIPAAPVDGKIFCDLLNVENNEAAIIKVTNFFILKILDG